VSLRAERRTLRGWFEYLDDPTRELTLDEFVAVMAFNSREYARLGLEHTRATAQAAEHTEGMLGAIDGLAEQIASRSGLPYASSGAVRAALDDARDRARRLAAAETET
jgi:hypothetical protein